MVKLARGAAGMALGALTHSEGFLFQVDFMSVPT